MMPPSYPVALDSPVVAFPIGVMVALLSAILVAVVVRR